MSATLAPVMLSVDQVAVRCGVSRDAVRRAIRRGDLAASKVFGRVRVDEQDLNEYIARSTVGGQAVGRRRRRPDRVEQRGGLQALNRRAA